MSNFPVRVFAADAALTMSGWDLSETRYTLDVFQPSIEKWIMNETEHAPLVFIENATVNSFVSNGWFDLDNRLMERDPSESEPPNGNLRNLVSGVALIPTDKFRSNVRDIQHITVNFNDPLQNQEFTFELNVLGIRTQRRTFYDLVSVVTGPENAARRYTVHYISSNEKDYNAYIESESGQGRLYFPGSLMIEESSLNGTDLLQPNQEIFMTPILSDIGTHSAHSQHDDNDRFRFSGHLNHEVLINADGKPVSSTDTDATSYELLVDVNKIKSHLPVHIYSFPLGTEDVTVLQTDAEWVRVRQQDGTWILEVTSGISSRTAHVHLQTTPVRSLQFVIHGVSISRFFSRSLRLGRETLVVSLRGFQNVDQEWYPYRVALRYEDTHSSPGNRVIYPPPRPHSSVMYVVGNFPFRAHGTLVMLPLDRDTRQDNRLQPFSETWVQTLTRVHTAVGTNAFVSSSSNM